MQSSDGLEIQLAWERKFHTFTVSLCCFCSEIKYFSSKLVIVTSKTISLKPNFAPVIFLYSLSCILFFACGTNKETVASRSMQNLTSRYNILYNANELLKETELVLQQGYAEDYGQLLTVYKEPTEEFAKAELGNLDSIILKANTIISEKAQSEYVNDAYFLVAKINYLKTNFFNAAEFFDYIYLTYPEEKEARQHALVWKARSLIRLNNLTEAAQVLDTALKYIETGKNVKADVYATEAQFNIKTANEANAIETLQKAIKAGSNRTNELRWTYLLAQLQERNGKPQEAYENYSTIVKSNAPFEMAFNANVNRIRLAQGEANTVDNRIKQLKALIKDDKNKDFIDQIYYRLGDIYLEQGQKEKAIEQYNLALRLNTKNQNQKGLTYLRLAELYFKDADYVNAKAYYDSTLTSLMPTYAGYDGIRLKASNLELLADRYKIIAEQDTLLSLSRLPEEKREIRIGELVREQVRKASGQSPSTPDAFTAGIDAPGKTGTEGKFYFNNSIALSQGFTDFKRRWGNRKLEDNWRRSSKSAAETIASVNASPDASRAGQSSGPGVSIDALMRNYRDNVPSTPLQIQQANDKIINAYYDIAGFYKDELKDNAEAIKIYERLLEQYPENSYLAAIYYNLHRIYANTNTTKADENRNIVLTRFPESTYAKVLRDPGYGKQTDEKLAASTAAYNQSYALYVDRKYDAVLSNISQADAALGKNILSPQFAYLSALAVGRTQKLDVFEASLKELISTYPDDKLVTPLVKQQLDYIGANRDNLAKRPVAIIDFDPNEPRFMLEPTPDTKIAAAKPANQKPITDAKIPDLAAVAPVNSPATIINPPGNPDQNTPATLPAAPKTIFSLPDSAEYYFVVNVSDPGVNLSSSRFGIGQFNRANFAQGQIRHQLKDVNSENQLIYVGSFSSLGGAKEYERNIVPLIPSIMKVPAAKYNTFVISKESLDKLSTRDLISSYIEFYRQH